MNTNVKQKLFKTGYNVQERADVCDNVINFIT